MNDDEKYDEKFTAAIATALRQRKKEAGIRSIRQNYKGTGSQRANRQLYVNFKNGSVIDIWISPAKVWYGGVIWRQSDGSNTRLPPYHISGSPDDIADRIVTDLTEWAGVTQTA